MRKLCFFIVVVFCQILISRALIFGGIDELFDSTERGYFYSKSFGRAEFLKDGVTAIVPALLISKRGFLLAFDKQAEIKSIEHGGELYSVKSHSRLLTGPDDLDILLCRVDRDVKNGCIVKEKLLQTLEGRGYENAPAKIIGYGEDVFPKDSKKRGPREYTDSFLSECLQAGTVALKSAVELAQEIIVPFSDLKEDRTEFECCLGPGSAGSFLISDDGSKLTLLGISIRDQNKDIIHSSTAYYGRKSEFIRASVFWPLLEKDKVRIHIRPEEIALGKQDFSIQDPFLLKGKITYRYLNGMVYIHDLKSPRIFSTAKVYSNGCIHLKSNNGKKLWCKLSNFQNKLSDITSCIHPEGNKETIFPDGRIRWVTTSGKSYELNAEATELNDISAEKLTIAKLNENLEMNSQEREEKTSKSKCHVNHDKEEFKEGAKDNVKDESLQAFSKILTQDEEPLIKYEVEVKNEDSFEELADQDPNHFFEGQYQKNDSPQTISEAILDSAVVSIKEVPENNLEEVARSKNAPSGVCLSENLGRESNELMQEAWNGKEFLEPKITYISDNKNIERTDYPHGVIQIKYLELPAYTEQLNQKKSHEYGMIKYYPNGLTAIFLTKGGCVWVYEEVKEFKVRTSWIDQNGVEEIVFPGGAVEWRHKNGYITRRQKDQLIRYYPADVFEIKDKNQILVNFPNGWIMTRSRSKYTKSEIKWEKNVPREMKTSSVDCKLRDGFRYRIYRDGRICRWLDGYEVEPQIRSFDLELSVRRNDAKQQITLGPCLNQESKKRKRDFEKSIQQNS